MRICKDKIVFATSNYKSVGTKNDMDDKFFLHATTVEKVYGFYVWKPISCFELFASLSQGSLASAYCFVPSESSSHSLLLLRLVGQ